VKEYHRQPLSCLGTGWLMTPDKGICLGSRQRCNPPRNPDPLPSLNRGLSWALFLAIQRCWVRLMKARSIQPAPQGWLTAMPISLLPRSGIVKGGEICWVLGQRTKGGAVLGLIELL